MAAAAAAAAASTNSSARTSLSGPTLHDNRPASPDLSATNTGAAATTSSASEYGLPPNTVGDNYYPAPTALSSMNHTPPYMDVHSSHLSSAQPYASQAATAGGMSHYSYPQQPPIMQPASSTYGPASSYHQYGYGVTSPQSATQPPSTSMSSQVQAQLLPLPVSNTSVAPPGYGNTSGTPLQGYVYDTTGQVAPPGAKPRVTATLWEDEGSLCYQVEAKGVCVARREGMYLSPARYLWQMLTKHRQPHDQRHQAAQCCGHDPWSS